MILKEEGAGDKEGRGGIGDIGARSTPLVRARVSPKALEFN